jgi:DNA helicase HerA-like ATPase
VTPTNKRVELFPKEQIVGIFRGFTEGGLEFHADLALPYRSDFQTIPMHGQFLVVQLESPDEAVLGRVSSLSSEGRLTGPSGEEFNIRAMREGRTVPEQLREDYLKYRVDIRVLGVIRRDEKNGVQFVASHRRLPHVGSPVAFLNHELLRFVAGHYDDGADLGFLAFGEFVYAEGDDRLKADRAVQVRPPATIVHFPVASLVSRRTFVFARAGFGKSNLNKLLFSDLYEGTPHVEKRGGRKVPVGTILFDPDGEYFWPDDKGRPGLCDVPALQDQVVVFTPREAPSPFYGSFVAGDIKLDVRRLRPADVISIALSPEKQDQQNVRKLKGMNDAAWMELVDIIERDGHSAELNEICRLMRLDEGKQEAEALAGRANMTTIVRMLHDPSSRLLDTLMAALADGKLCVVDISKLRGEAGLVLSGLLLRRIFQRNQDEFTKAEPQSVPTIAVVEEAQSVLRENHAASAPYVEWVKEGRKYDLGAVLITQQPGSIPTEILSQGDNWFLFHLLSAADLQKVRQANAHFSEDILSALLNEPIPGQGVFWSSVAGKPYPLALRVLLFEDMYPRRDANYTGRAVETYATRLRARFAARPKMLPAAVAADGAGKVAVVELEPASAGEQGQDALRTYQSAAIEALRGNDNFHRSIERGGIPYGVVVGILKESFPEDFDNRDDLAYSLVPQALDVVLGGKQRVAWDTEYRPNKAGGRTNYVYIPKGGA